MVRLAWKEKPIQSRKRRKSMIFPIQELNSNPWKKLAEEYRKEILRLQEDINLSYEQFSTSKEIIKLLDIERDSTIQKENPFQYLII